MTHSKLIAHAYGGRESSLDIRLSWCLTAVAGMRVGNFQSLRRLILCHPISSRSRSWFKLGPGAIGRTVRTVVTPGRHLHEIRVGNVCLQKLIEHLAKTRLIVILSL